MDHKATILSTMTPKFDRTTTKKQIQGSQTQIMDLPSFLRCSAKIDNFQLVAGGQKIGFWLEYITFKTLNKT